MAYQRTTASRSGGLIDGSQPRGVNAVGAGTQAFCSGGDQAVRGEGGYVGPDRVPRLNVLDLQASAVLDTT